MIFAVALVVLGLGGVGWVLSGLGLDRAEKWVSLVGVFLSVSLGAAGVILGWATWRHSRGPERPATTAAGPSSVAVADANSGKIDAQATGASGENRAGSAPPGGVTALGPASVAIGGTNTADITTRFDGTPHRPKDE
ncbi:hypothetical protein [Actinoplanes flavus]|uniref:Uncharacterized protein n=1 Tax=Actinoplanes flavus TaxID=2820290 RepID=A0ABS3V0A9_9ACTN|nr:hypothetical protein [Actinoplanes flavus]MBO3744277.1 hypothetical protein [Actinoplanes flavus]